MNTLPNEVNNVILLQLEFNDLNNVSLVNKFFNNILDNIFWKDKYEQDFIKINNIELWKGSYFRALNVNQDYPELNYELTNNDIEAVYGEIPILKSESIDYLLIKLIRDECYAICLENDKFLILYNKYHDRSEEQEAYENNVEHYVWNNIKLLVKNVGDCIVFYMHEYDHWAQILTKRDDYYEITLLKEDRYEF